jgi:hypothetical protein
MRLTNKTITIPKTFRRMFVAIMIFLTGGLCFLTICTFLMLLNNTIRTPPEPFKYEIVEFSPCSGWSNSGLAEKKQIFRPDEDHIFACGRIETNRSSILLIVYWDYEGQEIHRDVIRDVKDQFISELPPIGKDFAVGNYEVRLVIGRETVGRAEFKVTSPE